jgi:hypothetical protein
MERKIFKYTLPLAEHSIVEMPAGAEVLSVHNQKDALCVWAMIDPAQAQMKKRMFFIVGTGISMEYHDMMRFIGTAHLHGGSLVLHVFEIKR